MPYNHAHNQLMSRRFQFSLRETVEVFALLVGLAVLAAIARRHWVASFAFGGHPVGWQRDLIIVFVIAVPALIYVLTRLR